MAFHHHMILTLHLKNGYFFNLPLFMLPKNLADLGEGNPTRKKSRQSDNNRVESQYHLSQNPLLFTYFNQWEESW